ncbi:MAG: 5-dehydro-4-deoxy-D-glucuronate isomerase [Coraliomargaritaceae bacterium]
MDVNYSPNIENFKRMTTAEVRSHFLLEKLFQPNQCELVYWEVDRAIIGSAVPTNESLRLEAPEEIIAADFFCQRREVGVINLGGSGTIRTDEKNWKVAKCDTLYIGRGTREVSFTSEDPTDPAKFYIVSYPAHTEYPTALSGSETTNRVELGSQDMSNDRVIHQQIHQDGIRSCQLVMGYTELKSGSVWNTFPPHTHLRRSEVYNYFDLADENIVMHFMGPAEASRNIVVRNFQPVLSPAWSIHCGAGSSSYKFVWAMGGENQEFTDMDGIPMAQLS